MAKYHINSKGEAGKCSAQAGNCPFGGEHQHYDTAEKAQKAFELSMAGSTLPKAEKRVESTALPVLTKTVREPGEHPYEEVSRPDGTALGTVTYRDGFYIAAVHNGRAPSNIGSFNGRAEALVALSNNGGAGQVQANGKVLGGTRPLQYDAARYQQTLDGKNLRQLQEEKDSLLRSSMSREERTSRLEAVQATLDSYFEKNYEGFQEFDLRFNEQKHLDDLSDPQKAPAWVDATDEKKRDHVERIRKEWLAKARTAPAKSYEEGVPIRLLPVGSEVNAPWTAGSKGYAPYRKIGTPVDNGPIMDKDGNPTKSHDIVGRYWDGQQWDYVDGDTTFNTAMVPAGKRLSPRWSAANAKAAKLSVMREKYETLEK